MSIIEVMALEDLAGTSGFIADGDWIESRDQDPTGSIRLIQLADIGEGVFLNRSRRFINTATAKRLRCTLLSPGDVLIARMPDPLGRACVFPDIGQQAITAVDVCILRSDTTVADPDWIEMAINTPETRRKIETLAQGATRARVPTGQLRKLELLVPVVIDEQRRIAARLKAQLAAVADARSAAQAQAKGALLLASRFREQNFEALDHAKRVPLGELLQDIEAGKSFQTSDRLATEHELGVLKVSAVSWAEFRPSEAKAIDGVYEPDARHYVKRGDLLISRANTVELVGAVVRAERDYPNRLLSDKTLRLLLDERRVNPDYLIQVLRMPQAREHIESNATGTSDSMRNISQGTIRAIPVPLPDMETQIALALRLKQADAELRILTQASQAQLREIDLLPARLLAQAFESGTRP